MSRETDQLKTHLAILNAFIESPVHFGYLAARDEEIANIEQRILMTPPVTDVQRAEVLMAHGELDCQKEMKKTFEDARVTLKARIDEMVERDNKNAVNTKV